MIEIKNYYWDRSIIDKNPLNDPEIFTRILNYGNIEEINYLINKLGIKKIKNFVLKYPYKLKKRSLSFWKVICGIKRGNKITKTNIRTSVKL